MPMRIGEVVRSQFSDEEGKNGIGNLLLSAEGARRRYDRGRIVAQLSAGLSPPRFPRWPNRRIVGVRGFPRASALSSSAGRAADPD